MIYFCGNIALLQCNPHKPMMGLVPFNLLSCKHTPTHTDVDRDGAFCINGLEFDLDELERFKTKLAAKRAAASATVSDDTVVDELDDYLDRMALDVADKHVDQPLPTPQVRSDNVDVGNAIASSTPGIVDVNAVGVTSIDQPEQHQQQQSQPVLLYFALGLLFFVSTVTASLPSNSNSSSSNLGCKRAHCRPESY